MKSEEKAAIRKELEGIRGSTFSDLWNHVTNGETRAVANYWILFRPGGGIVEAFCLFTEKLKGHCCQGNGEKAEAVLETLLLLSVGFRSFLPEWRALSKDLIPAGQISKLVEITKEAFATLCQRYPQAASPLLQRESVWNEARYRAEEAAEPAAKAKALAGSSLADYSDRLVEEISKSNLTPLARMRLQGKTRTEFSNDFAAFLEYAIWLGASFCTTNPPLVHMAWKALPGYWDRSLEGIIAENQECSDEEIARLITLEVVLYNIRLLRPLYLLSGGNLGYVCLQVSPKKHDDAAGMKEDAQFFHKELQRRLGGTPNVLFKLPATYSGLETGKFLTANGMGITITVSFGVFQHIPFIKAIIDGTADHCALTEMNGRLAFPIRDELLAKLAELQKMGYSEGKVRAAAAWSGVAVARKIHRQLEAKGVSGNRMRPLIASLRVYAGSAQGDLAESFPDITETTGTGILSVFPNVRWAFDAEQRPALQPAQIEQPVAQEMMEILKHSEIFRQAYYTSDADWREADEEEYKPAYPLLLEDEAAVLQWAPIHQTLSQFVAAYDDYVHDIGGRKQAPMAKEA